MSFREINDYDLIRSDDLGLDAVCSILEEKYKDKIDRARKYTDFLGLPENEYNYFEDMVKDTKKEVDGFNVIPSKKEPSEYKNIIGNKLDIAIEHLGLTIYKRSSMELSYESFEEYLLMVAGKSDEELRYEQKEAFNYVDRPLKLDEEQVYDSLLSLEGYLYDIESGEVMFSIGQRAIIEKTIGSIRVALEDQDVVLAKLKLVSLQMLMGLNVQFLPVLNYILKNGIQLRDYVDYDLGNDYRLGEGRSKHL